MGWYKLVFKQNQPIHVGSTKWGVVKETEIFIPGSTMWGALTNIYLQLKKNERNTNNEEDIKEIRTYFQTISNFFPSFDGKTPLQPIYQKGEFGYLDKGKFISEDKFRFYFVDTIVQTAIEPIARQAKDDSLHELDYILPKPKQNLEFFHDGLYWIGIIYINNDELIHFLKNIKNIFVGADVRYGYGELELVECKALEENEKDFWWIDDLNKNNINTKINTSSPYFIEIKENLKIKGEIFIVPEVDFRQNIPRLIEAKFFTFVGNSVETNLVAILSKGKLLLS